MSDTSYGSFYGVKVVEQPASLPRQLGRAEARANARAQRKALGRIKQQRYSHMDKQGRIEIINGKPHVIRRVN